MAVLKIESSVGTPALSVPISISTDVKEIGSRNELCASVKIDLEIRI